MKILWWLVVVLAIVNIPIYAILASVFFGKGTGGLGEGLRYAFTPDIISMFRGEYWEDRWASFKLSLWILLCIGAVAAEYKLLSVIFDF